MTALRLIRVLEVLNKYVSAPESALALSSHALALAAPTGEKSEPIVARMHASAFTTDEVSWMGSALEEARRAEAAGEVPVGAVVVLEGEIIGAGCNTTEHSDDPAGHAEINALRAAGAAFGDWRLEGSTLVVTLEPCTMCIGAIALARAQRIVYGASDPRLGACGSALDLFDATVAPHLRSVEGGLMEEECSALLKAFFRSLREHEGVR